MGLKNIAGGWQVDYRDERRRQRRKTFRGQGAKQLAEAYLGKRLIEVREARLLGIKPRPRITLGELVVEYLNQARHEKRSWRKDRERAKVITEHFGERTPAVEIRRADAERFKFKRKKTPTIHGRERAASTVNRDLAVLKRLFSWAVDNELLDSNPIAGLKLFPEDNVRDRVVTVDELERLLAALPGHYQPITIVAHETGMRQGELLGLTWDRLDLDEGFIFLRPEDTKTKRARMVPLTPQAVEAIQSAAASRECPFVFQRSPGIRLGFSRWTWHRARLRADLADVCFHSLRHTFVTNARRAGIPDVEIMAITGHRTMAVFRRYNTVDKLDLRAAAARLHAARSGPVVLANEPRTENKTDRKRRMA